MSKKFIKVFFLSVILSMMSVISGLSQNIRSFNDYIENYPETVASMFQANLSIEDRALIELFNSAWNDATFTSNEKISIILISNAFLEKRVRNIHFWTLWRCLLSFKEPENMGKGLEAWTKSVISICQDRRSTPTSLQTLMTSTLELVNNRLIYSSAGHAWKVSNNNYRYDFTDDNLSVIVDGCDLSCVLRNDSIVIYQTSGRFSIEEQEWQGRNGTVNWERAGFAPGEITARLGRYTINMRRPEYEVDSVMLTHYQYFPSPVMGKLNDRLRHISNPEAALFPEFITYGSNFVFNNMYPDVDYKGGFTIQGARVIGSGTDNENAMLTIRKGGDSLRMNIMAKSFVFLRERVSSRNVMLAIHFFGDSIYHTNLSFSYLVDSREVNLFRTDAATSQAPYFNTYHRISLNFEQLVWRTNEPLMIFSMARGATFGRATFRSQNYFDQQYFDRLRYMDAVNPLEIMRQIAASRGPTFPASAYASHVRTTISDARVQLINLARQGFILFDSERDIATVQPHLYEMLDAAAQRRDFDVIELNSAVNAPVQNAIFDVRTHDLAINGIQSFMVSDSQRVIISPRDQRVLMQKNRAIEIDGRVDAGRIEMHGDLMRFDYDGFRIDLSKVDSMYIRIPTGDTDFYGRPVEQRLRTALTGLSGRLLIDQPNNKSGRRSLKQYPILFNDSVAYVRYASSNIEGGAYTDESFYFAVDPFVLDSIDNLTKQSIAFHGNFVSAGIFDDMRQTLLVQPDYSLGFIHSADTAISAYKQADMYAEVRMSNRGLEASGRLEYLTSTILADNFKLYPDSMNVLEAKDFSMQKQTSGVEFPEVHAQGSRIHWTPKKEQMLVMNKNFNMYNPDTHLDGALLLTPGGLSGRGLVNMANGTAELRSEDFTFNANRFGSEQSNLVMRAVQDGPYRVMTIDSLRSEINFDNRTGRFQPNGSKNYTLVDFPSNRFAGYVEEMIWDIDNAMLDINSVDTVIAPINFRYAYPGESRGSRYYATSPGADSLSFVAPRATLDLTQGDLKAEGVNLVKTHDAIVYPGEGKLTVNTNGELELEESTIVFNDELKQFTIYDANLRMQGRRQYSGFGKYDYIDETGTPSVIDISYLGFDRANEKTVASGNIPASDEFKLSPYFSYQGNITLASDEQYPVFEGSAKIVHECATLEPEWFRFTTSVNPDSIFIPVNDAPVNINGNRIYNGFFLDYDSIYPAYFSMRKTPGDRQLINTSGLLTYDKDSMTYFMAPESKLLDRDTIGNLFALNRDRCLLSAEGRFMSLGVDFGRVETDAAGKIMYNLNNNEVFLDIMMSFNFHFDVQLASMMASIIENYDGLAAVDMQRPTFVRGMNEWLGIGKSQAYRTEALLGKVEEFPAELSSKTLVLTQLQLYWDYTTRSYRSTGKIGVGNLFGNQVNRLVDGMVEISRRGTGDLFDIYLRMDDNNWIYIRYTREMMQISTSDRAVNDFLVKIPERRRRMSERRPGFTYMIAAAETVNQFMRQYQQRGVAPVMPTSGSPVIQQQQQQQQQPIPVTPPPDDDVPIIEID